MDRYSQNNLTLLIIMDVYVNLYFYLLFKRMELIKANFAVNTLYIFEISFAHLNFL